MARDQDGGELASIPDEERRARLAWLMQIRRPLTESEDAALRASFSDIVRPHQGPVQAQLRRRGLQAAEIDDLVQVIFLGLHASLKRRGFPESIAALLYTIMRRKVGNYLRDRNREPYSVGLPSSGSEPPRSPPDPGRAIDREAAQEWLISHLSHEEHAAFEAVELDGLKQEDAALALDIPLGTFKRRLSQARKKVAELIAQIKGREGTAA